MKVLTVFGTSQEAISMVVPKVRSSGLNSDKMMAIILNSGYEMNNQKIILITRRHHEKYSDADLVYPTQLNTRRVLHPNNPYNEGKSCEPW